MPKLKCQLCRKKPAKVAISEGTALFFVCKGCRKKKKHIKRIKQNNPYMQQPILAVNKKEKEEIPNMTVGEVCNFFTKKLKKKDYYFVMMRLGSRRKIRSNTKVRNLR